MLDKEEGKERRLCLPNTAVASLPTSEMYGASRMFRLIGLEIVQHDAITIKWGNPDGLSFVKPMLLFGG